MNKIELQEELITMLESELKLIANYVFWSDVVDKDRVKELRSVAKTALERLDLLKNKSIGELR